MSRPAFRRLRGYASDPSLSTMLETAQINAVTFSVPWEDVQPGPVGEYLEVIDHDPLSACFYKPVNLNDINLVAQDGWAPSESNPQFHQQMVYAVAMKTIGHFERALGRDAMWADHDPVGGQHREFLQRLRIHPHALRAANAFYSPDKKALLFGYFRASNDGVHVPGSTVFTCLSFDIVAHETAHALLDGMHRRFIEPTHPDGLAFHEAFADLVAIFQHFTMPEVLKHQIARTRGDLEKSNMLAELAQEFGRATGCRGALRNALGSKPDPEALRMIVEPHARGSILVAAVFDAFIQICRRRAEPIIGLATQGSGVLPPGHLTLNVVDALAAEAAKVAEHFLNVCIRALDYCPPVDVTFGDYLRALITADADLVPDDPHGYRIAFVEAFRKRGIFPDGVRNLSEESLLWPSCDYRASWLVEKLRRKQPQIQYAASREERWERARDLRAWLHDQLACEPNDDLEKFSAETHLALGASGPSGLRRSKMTNRPVFEVHGLQEVRRAAPDGSLRNQVIVTITQKRDIPAENGQPAFKFRGGTTLIFDLDTLELKYCISKPIDDEARLARQKAFLKDGLPPAIRAAFFGEGRIANRFEPLAMLHGGEWQENHNAE
ncbi:MAG: hypothetical protein IAG10_30340 [Planctomycetaceae bacterium]|nr:hypothetical protein [Planctomycetaceae bacterium]